MVFSELADRVNRHSKPQRSLWPFWVISLLIAAAAGVLCASAFVGGYLWQ